jgi:Holliday junction DNA helicase RuvA
MIGRLRGEIVHKQPPWLLLDVHGVGYELEAPMSTFYNLPAVGEQVTLLTHLVVREDAQVLYGFASEAERGLFRGLLKVSGVGPKVALAILSGMSAQEFGRRVRGDDVAALTRLPGVGKKTAERLIVEMRDRLGAASVSVLSAARTGGLPVGALTPAEEAASALEALGYRPQDALRMVKAVPCEGLGSEEIIRAALQGAVRR